MANRIIVNLKDISISEGIKKWKQKSTYVLKEYKKNIEYIKPSVKRRKAIKKAIKTQQYNNTQNRAQ
jgi:ribosomal protein S21